MDDKQTYLELYNKYKSIHNDSPLKAKNISAEFVMPSPNTWTKESVKLKAFLDKDFYFYIDDLSPFEYMLRRTIQDSNKYKELIEIYRNEYFRYQENYPSSNFFLLFFETNTTPDYTEEKNLSILVQENIFNLDVSLFDLLRIFFQKKLDLYREQNIKPESITLAKLHEKAILNDYEEAYLKLSLFIVRESRELAKLLQNYVPIVRDTSRIPLKNYFQDLYDLANEEELIAYIQDAKESLHVTKDIESIRAAIQNKISLNNKNAEQALAQGKRENTGDILLQYASLEQDFTTSYRSLLARYYLLTSAKDDFLLSQKPFELYFDNYFADFDQKLHYYKTLYKNQNISLVQTPYYIKMLNATQAKVSIVYRNMQEKLEAAKINYIKERSRLTELTLLKKSYQKEVATLFDEFNLYGEIYIKEIDENKIDLQQHTDYIKKLKERYDLRKSNGFF